MSQPETADEAMGNLESSYAVIEEALTWPEGSKGLFQTEVRTRSLREKLDPNSYEKRLYILLGFVDNLRDALNPLPLKHREEFPRIIWRHQNIDLTVGYINEKDKPNIDRQNLLDQVATYLSYPWLQSNIVDWIFIDSLIFAELLAYSEAIYSGQAFGKVNWFYIMAGGNRLKTTWYRMAMTLAVSILRYVLPLGMLYWIYTRYSVDITIIAAGIYLAYLIIHFPLRYFKRKSNNSAVEENLGRLKKMLDAYYYCKPPVISISSLKKYLEIAVESGAIFEGALFSIINRFEKEKGETLIKI
jgi:hypothetical protein